MKQKLVIDSSVIVKWINSQNESQLEPANQILQDAQDEKIELLAPELAKYEVGSALLYKGLELSTAQVSLGTIYALPITFIPLARPGAEEVLEIAQQRKITYYDAAFLQLAQESGATLITANPKHQKQFDKVKVVNLKDYPIT